MRVHQIHNRFIYSISSTELSLSEIYVLIELDIQPSVSIKDLCTILHLDRNSVSRAIKKLEDSKVVVSQPSPLDKRSRCFRILDKGYKALEVHNQNNREVIKRFLPNLSFQEVTELSGYYHRISQALGEPKTTIRKEEHPFIEPVRRVTRAFGFVGASLFGSGYSSLVWQMLSAIQHREDGPATLSLLATGLRIHPATLSQKIDRLEREKLLRRIPLTSDGRKKMLQLTKKGEACLREIELCGVSLLSKAFAPEDAHELSRFVYVVEKFLEISNESTRHILRESVQIEAISEAEKTHARGFIVFERARLGLFDDVPQMLIGDDSYCYVVKQGAEILALCEFTVHHATAVARNFVYSTTAQKQNLLGDFVDELGRIARQEFGVTTFKVPSLLADEVPAWSTHTTLQIESLDDS